MMFDKVRVVLVHTSHPGNIGGTARAMKNMGLSKLYLVGPKEFPSDVAVGRAAGADDVLRNAVVVEHLEDAVADCGLVVGASARQRHIPWPVVDPRECGAKVLEAAVGNEVALVFGREDRGLTNEELRRCHFHVHIPSDPDYSSLNLATAVQVVTYEVRMAFLQQQKNLADHTPESLPWGVAWDRKMATGGEMERYFEHLEQVLQELDFLDPGNPRQLMTRLRRLYLRSGPDQVEINVLRGILTATQKVLKQG